MTNAAPEKNRDILSLTVLKKLSNKRENEEKERKITQLHMDFFSSARMHFNRLHNHQPIEIL